MFAAIKQRFWGGERLTKLSASLGRHGFGDKCRAYLRRRGWHDLGEVAHGEPLIEKDGLYIRLAFLGPGERLTEALRSDYLEARLRSDDIFVVVLYDPPDFAFLQFAADSHFLLCVYTELHNLAEFCRPHIQARQRTPDLGFAGCVDQVFYPRILRGWVRLREHYGLGGPFTIKIYKVTTLIATSVPDHPRPDVTDSEDFLAGFTAQCETEFTPEDILEDRLHISAISAENDVYDVPVWDEVKAQARQILLQNAQSVAPMSAIDRLLYRE